MPAAITSDIRTIETANRNLVHRVIIDIQDPRSTIAVARVDTKTGDATVIASATVLASLSRGDETQINFHIDNTNFDLGGCPAAQRPACWKSCPPPSAQSYRARHHPSSDDRTVLWLASRLARCADDALERRRRSKPGK